MRNDNHFPFETRALEQDSNADPDPPQTASPGDQGADCPCFSGVKPPQAEAKRDCQSNEASQTRAITPPNKGLIKAPNGGDKTPTISFVGLKATPVANQEPSLGRGMGLWPDPMTTTTETENQVANLRSLTNKRTPGPGAILPPLILSTQIPWTHNS
ncbi:hypothetical protein DSO57_1013153 [Entomophthora muscae]|uniref:Uncharacterized protein n=1 Tax=Entomophthora muscae TaxID=34485 RepID=A0ACC2TGL0_9FUNG|nr:hypothetical protein DSO57_1013153 [Entomophthora muscae]